MRLSEDHEQELLQKLREGSVQSFEILYHKYSRELYWKIRQMVKEAEQADELLQELFVKIWERREKIDPSQPFPAYLYRVAKNMAVDHFRKIARDAKLYEGFQNQTTELDSSTENTIFANETGALLQKAIDQLSPARKQAFILCKIEGKSHQEAAEIMGISPNTVHNHLVKSLSLIRNSLKNADQELTTVAIILSMIIRQ